MAVPFFNLAPDMTVSRLCLGTMTFGEQNTLPQSFQLLDKALDSGINFFDSAEMYPVPQRAETQGRSEEYFGRWMRSRKIPRDRVIFATKVSGPSGQMTWIRNGPESLDTWNITEAIDNSLLRLQSDYIDLYQIHWPDRYVPMFGETEYDPTQNYSSVSIDEQLSALAKAIDAGKIRYIGLSNETPYGLMKFLHVAECGSGYPRIVSVQNSYNLLCRTFDSGMAECCHHERVSLLAYSPLAMGILSGKYLSLDGCPADARLNLFRGRYVEGESRYNLSSGLIRKTTELYLDIAANYGIHPVSLAIAFVLRHPLVASAVFGATKPWQLEEVLDGCRVELIPEIVAEIDRSSYNLLCRTFDSGTTECYHHESISQINLDIAANYGVHPVSLAIGSLLLKSLFFGATKPWQLEEVLDVCKVELIPEIVAEIVFPNPCP